RPRRCRSDTGPPPLRPVRPRAGRIRDRLLRVRDHGAAARDRLRTAARDDGHPARRRAGARRLGDQRLRRRGGHRCPAAVAARGPAEPGPADRGVRDPAGREHPGLRHHAQLRADHRRPLPGRTAARRLSGGGRPAGQHPDGPRLAGEGRRTGHVGPDRREPGGGAAADRARPHRRLACGLPRDRCGTRSEEHTSELQSRFDLVCRLLPPALSSLCLHDALPISHGAYLGVAALLASTLMGPGSQGKGAALAMSGLTVANLAGVPLLTALGHTAGWRAAFLAIAAAPDRKSTRLNSSHVSTSYAVFCPPRCRACASTTLFRSRTAPIWGWPPCWPAP